MDGAIEPLTLPRVNMADPSGLPPAWPHAVPSGLHQVIHHDPRHSAFSLGTNPKLQPKLQSSPNQSAAGCRFEADATMVYLERRRAPPVLKPARVGKIEFRRLPTFSTSSTHTRQTPSEFLSSGHRPSPSWCPSNLRLPGPGQLVAPSSHPNPFHSHVFLAPANHWPHQAIQNCVRWARSCPQRLWLCPSQEQEQESERRVWIESRLCSRVWRQERHWVYRG